MNTTMRRWSCAAAVLATVLVTAASAAAQTLTLRDSSATTLRGGSYANTNFANALELETRASGDPTYVRRIQTKFDTHNTIPLGTSVASATLTLTVAGGNSETRLLTAYRGGYSYDEWVATWNARKSGTWWPAPGGDTGEVAAQANATASVGSKVTFDVTAVVRNIVAGKYGSSSRYARFLIADMGGSSREGYKQYYSDEAGDASVRPVLEITLGSGSSPAPAPSPAPSPSPSPAPEPEPSGSGVKLKVLQWNLHHGVGTDGR